MFSKEFILLFCSLVAGVFLGELGSMTTPFQIGALMDGLNLGEAAAGMLGSAEIVTIGCCMLAVALGAIRMAPRQMALCGAVITGTGQLLTALTDILALLFILRVAVGLGSALCLSAAIITISSFKHPESTTGFVYAYVILLLALIMYLIPWLLPYGHHRALFSLFAALTILGSLLLLNLPARQIYQQQVFKVNGDNNIYRLIALLFVGEFLLLAGVGTVWAFLERIGLATGITPHDVGLYMSLGMLVSMLGSFVAGIVGVNFGRSLPLVGGAILTAAGSGLVPGSTDAASYLIMLFLFLFMLSFVLPYVIGTAAMIDRSGRLATAALAVQIFSYGTGVVIGGFVVEHFSLGALSYIGFSGPVLAACFFFVVCRKLSGPYAIPAK
ncbi:MAG: hypothetical protein OXI88_12645 [Gammaproteobacteria bacterium]|nr:hypothetical protein [Gammaproteobacteria bacterium]MDE0284862.1 hypothetical protein [Gammaproteobacteria bacterium]MDE0512624.1 hypothetical protein [Gammaproteobacteria bacterium]